MGHKSALAAPLGFVQRAVGRAQQLFGGFAVLRRACAADAYSDMDPGRVKMRRRSITIAHVNRSRPRHVPTSQAHSTLQSKSTISFSSRFELLSSHTTWTGSGRPRSNGCAMPAMMRSAIFSAWSEEITGSRITNSSPPILDMKSSGRTQPARHRDLVF
jgi:hypothetical protein